MTLEPTKPWEHDHKRLVRAPGSSKSGDVEITFTRNGLEVKVGMPGRVVYDGFAGIGPTTLIPWDEIDRVRADLARKKTLPGRSAP